MPVPGTVIGKYEIQRQIGEGGFGQVFVARDRGLDRECALKVLLAEHTSRPELLQRFLKEARAAAKIVHAGIVTVFECGVTDSGTAYIAMELLRGESLADRLRRGPLPIEHALEIARQVASALAAAHAQEIVHRDLKPDNIFLVPDPATTLGERAKVLDFGIAKLAGDARDAAKTSTHMIFGTPRYMSPEQCKSTASVDERSDIYALGCILFECCTGRPPFDGDAGELIAMHQLAAPPAARTLRQDLPVELELTIATMLAKRPADRPATMTDVLARLGGRSSAASARGSLGVAPTLPPHAPTSAPPPSAAPVATPPPPSMPPPPSLSPDVAREPLTAEPGARRSPWPFVALGGVLVAGAVIAIVALRERTPAPAPATPAVVAVAHDASVAVDAAPHVPAKPTAPDPLEVYAMPATGSIAWGPKTAKAIVVVGFDHGCAECAQVPALLAKLRAKYRDELRIVVRPLVLDDRAEASAHATCAAAKQSMRTYEKLDAAIWRAGRDAFDLPSAMGIACTQLEGECPQLGKIARGVGIELARMRPRISQCVDEVTAATRDWQQFGVRTAPSFFVNGHFLGGLPATETIERMIDLEIEKTYRRVMLGADLARYYQQYVLDLGLAQLEPRHRLESTDVLARPPRKGIAYVQTLLLQWRGMNTSDPRARTRSRDDTDALADELLAKLRAGADFREIMREHSSDPWDAKRDRPEPYTLDEPFDEEGKALAVRLRVGEIGAVRTMLGWRIMKGVEPPPPDPLDSTEILAREPRTQRAGVKTILIGWKEAHLGDKRSVTRDRAALEKAVQEILAQLAAGVSFDTLAKRTEEPGIPPGQAFLYTPMSNVIAPIKALVLRLEVGEVGVISTEFGVQIVKRVN